MPNFILFYSHTHDVSVQVPLIFSTLLTANFNYFRWSHSLSTRSLRLKNWISVNIDLSHILTMQIKFIKSITKDFECCQYFKISKYLSLIKASEKNISLNISQFNYKSECCHDGEIISPPKKNNQNEIWFVPGRNETLWHTELVLYEYL